MDFESLSSGVLPISSSREFTYCIRVNLGPGGGQPANVGS
jgi:hypothetical protein